MAHISFRALPRDDDDFMWVKSDRLNGGGILSGQFEESDAPSVDTGRLEGLAAPEQRTCTTRTSFNVLPVIGTTYDQPPSSRHRSKRLWKKLRRRTARPLYGKPTVLSLKAFRLDHRA